MAYQINKTDDTIVATVADGQVDNLSTDITLIGKNYNGFGEALNENFIKLLENFASTSRPTRPIRGQIWFDVNESKLKVYSGTEFLPVSSATIANVQPSTLSVGDLWFNDIDKQLYFFDGTAPILLGPSYSVSQGKSGLEVKSILDTLNQTRVITYLYTNGILLGIFSKDSFTPKTTIPGFVGNIIPGFNAGSLPGLKFNVTVTNSEQLGGTVSTTYVRKDTSNAINGQLRITTDLGIVVGSAGQANLTVSDGNVFISNASTDKDITLNVRKGIVQESAMIVTTRTREVEFYPGYSDSIVTVGGNLVVSGNLTVQGDVTTVSTSTVSVEDKNISLGTTDTPSNSYADGGGITLKGTESIAVMSGSTISGSTLTVGSLTSGIITAWMKLSGTGIADDTYITSNISGAGNGSTWTVSKSQSVSSTTITGRGGDKSLLWTASSTAWNSTEHINLAYGKEFKINGVTVINGSSLGPGITSIPGVSSIGKQTIVNVGPGLVTDPPQMRFENTKISTLSSNLDLELEPDGTGNVALIGNPKITGLLDPTDPQDASTKEYVDNTVETRPIILSMDLTDGKTNVYIINNILNRLAPPVSVTAPSLYRDGTQAKILCTILSNSTVSLNLNPLINQSIATFNTPSGTAPAVTNVAISTATVPAPSVSTTRIIKEFQILAGAWTHVSETVLPP